MNRVFFAQSAVNVVIRGINLQHFPLLNPPHLNTNPLPRIFTSNNQRQNPQ